MEPPDYIITAIRQEVPETFLLQVKPQDGHVFPFIAGQFVRIGNLKLPTPKGHFFSISSSPHTLDHLEFGFKMYGEWTKQLSEMKIGDTVQIQGPYGKFTWDSSEKNAVFLAGGIGIAPFVSMLRNIAEEKQTPRITLLYGNRTEEQIVYRSLVEDIISVLPESKVVHVLSDITESDPWTGYRGSLTKEILEKEVDFARNPTFFVCGPPVFVQLETDLLKQLGVNEANIKQELFSF